MKKLLTTICTAGVIFIVGTSEVRAANLEIGVSIPVHGNWCGPGYGGTKINSPKPIDTLDTGCMNHDLCYMKNGYYSKECDKQLIDYINNNRHKMSFFEKLKSYAVAGAFRLLGWLHISK